MLFLVATNVVACRPPERRPTGTLHARAKMIIILCIKNYKAIFDKFSKKVLPYRDLTESGVIKI